MSETWLQSHKDAELKIKGYTIFRCDTTKKKKSTRGRLTGGVELYVRDDIACSSEIIASYSTDAIHTNATDLPL